MENNFNHISFTFMNHINSLVGYSFMLKYFIMVTFKIDQNLTLYLVDYFIINFITYLKNCFINDLCY